MRHPRPDAPPSGIRHQLTAKHSITFIDMAEIKCIGILTSGGDAPGMNAAIRAVTRSAIFSGFKVKGIYRGYRGLVTDEIVEFSTANVSNIIQRGGTILKTARSEPSSIARIHGSDSFIIFRII